MFFWGASACGIWPKLGISIKETNVSAGIRASIISAHYQIKKGGTASPYSGTGPVPASLVFFFIL
jgi:hypothetical protein